MWIFSFPIPIAEGEKNPLSSLSHGLVSLVKNHLKIYVKVYFRSFYSISLVYVLAFMPVSQHPDYNNFRVSFKIRKCGAYNFVYNFQDFFQYLGVL